MKNFMRKIVFIFILLLFFTFNLISDVKIDKIGVINLDEVIAALKTPLF